MRRAAQLSNHPLSDQSVSGATIRFWAAARQAAGHGEEISIAASIGELRAELIQREKLVKIIAMASFLVDGVRADDLTVIKPGSVVDVLPPFAGG
jgi:sulfur-carrier protein